jgi:serine/threonine protein kinase/tetratricopeptide (TPR) repeat protein
MECPKCHSDNPEDSDFCSKCGTQISSSEEVSVSPTKTLETPSEELTRGTTFAKRYEIIEELGKGGMGKVYRVEDKKIKQEVALKLINPAIASDKRTIERFNNELKTARMISHRNVCRMFDLGEEKGAHYITMEYVSGEDLKSFIKRARQLTAGTAISIAKQVCEGLAEAHRLGVVHRDLKPQNVMIDKEGNSRIMDFGIARSLKAKGITGAGVMIGTPEYMSPEQVDGKDTDLRADIYSLGVILYEMVTGRVPFDAETPFAVGVKQKSEMPRSPQELNSQIPDDLSQLILRCLEKDKEKRPQSAVELGSDLTSIEKGIPTSEIEIPKRKPTTSKEITVTFQKRWMLVIAFAVVIAIAALAFLLLKGGKDAAPSGNKKLVVLPFEFLGPQEDEYFAHGITDEVTNRLSFLQGLDVISLASAVEYEKTSKSIKDIGKELGVDYVVTGTVSWDKSAGEQGKVRASPRLTRASDETQLWSERYEREIESIFDVQSEIAEDVIKQLDLTLLAPERRELRAKPTDNLEAYDFYLRGIEHRKKATLRIDSQDWNLAAEMFEKAIELDTNFVLAHVALSNVHSQIFFHGFDKTEERLSLSRKAVDKALELQPDSPEAKRALALYYYRGFRDYERALELFESVQKARPNSSPAQIAWIQRRQGKHQECLETIKKAIQLDPRSSELAKALANTYSWLRKYEEADRWFDRALSLSPDDFRAMIWKMANSFLKTGNTQEARALLQKLPPLPIIGLVWIIVEMADRNYEQVLEKLSSLPFEEFEFQDSYYNKDLMYATVYNAQNKPTLMETYAQSARTALEKRTSEHPEDVRYHVALSMVYALLDKKDEAIREADQAVNLVPVSLDAFAGPGYILNLAEILIRIREYDEAVDKLEYLMSIPAGQFVSVFSLQSDPKYDSLRDHPRFIRLLEKYSKED